MPRGIYARKGDRDMSLFKGRKHTDETKRKISERLKGKTVVGHPAWNKGKSWSKEVKKKISDAQQKDSFRSIILKIRECRTYKKWREDIFKRDNYTCVICKDNKGGNLNADHIKPLSFIIKKLNIKDMVSALECEELWNITNGRTLCEKCHRSTDTWGGKAKKYEDNFN